MSDFLNKFSKQDYKDDQKKKAEETVKASPDDAHVVEQEPLDSIETVEAIETKTIEQPVKHKPRSSHQEPEEVHIDPGYRRNQRNKLIGGAIAVVLLIAISFGAYYLLNQVQVPDYVNKPFSELKTWASRNNVILETEYAFSLEVSQDYVIEMVPLANSNIQKGSIMRVVVSSGADPDELIQVPDFTGNSYGQIQDWLNSNKINNLRITYENNEEIPVNEFVKIVFNDKTVTSDNYTRKDYGLIYISNGPIVYEKNIEVPDWSTTNVNVGVVEAWGLQNDVSIIVKQVNSSTVAMNGVINQSVAPKTMIAKKTSITISVSLGQVVVVPDFTKMTKEEASKVTLTNASIRFIETYQPANGATYGTYFWQDVSAGTKVNQTSTTQLVITVYYSKGRPFIDSLVGLSVSLIPDKIYSYNQFDANFTYDINYTCPDPNVVKGEIISMSHTNEFVDPGIFIQFEVSNCE